MNTNFILNELSKNNIFYILGFDKFGKIIYSTNVDYTVNSLFNDIFKNITFNELVNQLKKIKSVLLEHDDTLLLFSLISYENEEYLFYIKKIPIKDEYIKKLYKEKKPVIFWTITKDKKIFYFSYKNKILNLINRKNKFSIFLFYRIMETIHPAFRIEFARLFIIQYGIKESFYTMFQFSDKISKFKNNICLLSGRRIEDDLNNIICVGEIFLFDNISEIPDKYIFDDSFNSKFKVDLLTNKIIECNDFAVRNFLYKDKDELLKNEFYINGKFRDKNNTLGTDSTILKYPVKNTNKEILIVNNDATNIFNESIFGGLYFKSNLLYYLLQLLIYFTDKYFSVDSNTIEKILNNLMTILQTNNAFVYIKENMPTEEYYTLLLDCFKTYKEKGRLPENLIECNYKDIKKYFENNECVFGGKTILSKLVNKNDKLFSEDEKIILIPIYTYRINNKSPLSIIENNLSDLNKELYGLIGFIVNTKQFNILKNEIPIIKLIGLVISNIFSIFQIHKIINKKNDYYLSDLKKTMIQARKSFILNNHINKKNNG